MTIWGRRWAGLLVAGVVAMTACGDGGSDVEATAQLLTQAAERSDTEPHRVEVQLSLNGLGDGEAGTTGDEDAEAAPDQPFMIGERNGEQYHFLIDLGPVLAATAGGEGLPPELAEADPTIEIVGDDSVAYLRAPLMARTAEVQLAEAQADTEVDPEFAARWEELMGGLAQIDEQWGRIDLEEVPDFALTTIQSFLTGGTSYDPRRFLDTVAEAEDFAELEDGEVRGVDVRGLEAEISLGDLFDAQGIDTRAFPVPEALTATVPVEVWVDDEDRVRRVRYDFDQDDIMDAADIDPDEDDALAGVTLAGTLDMYDYGDDSIAVELPGDAVDITDGFVLLVTFG
jgi:hypothetical protein